ncbi:MAG: hypothetical protein U9N77_06445 [Thermodesulfobacteriota bacterium]|nr:hypothetical protein [Thermodesulfobacteriota bacterium]
MRITLKIIGFISGVILVGSLIIMNATPVVIDLVFIDGEVAVFIIIIASFITGFITCVIYLWLKKSLLVQKQSRQKSLRHDDLFGDD